MLLRSRLLLVPALMGSLLASCTTRRVSRDTETAAVAPALSVERFLQAANDRDLESMSRLFGTHDGPAADTGGTFGCFWKKLGSWLGLASACLDRSDVELRMNAIALVLQHDDYRIVSQREVPGRENPTMRVGVTLVQPTGREVQDVPFNVVRTDGGRWLVEQIGLDRITNR